MSDQTDNYIKLLTPYGLNPDEAGIYLYLLQKGFLTALDISRNMQLGRTKVYRILDKLNAKQLVQYQLHERGLKFGAAHPHKLEQLATERVQQAQNLQKQLPDLLTHLQQLTQTAGGKSKVLYYEGVEGLKQVSFNALRAEKLLRVFEMEHISDFLPRDFAEYFRTEQVKRGFLTLDLTNKPKFPGYTDVAELVKKYNQFRYINPEKLKIDFETMIYNNVYATYTYKGKEIFCVEIYNEQLAHMQKQLFDFVWKAAKPMRFLDARGAAELVSLAVRQQ